MKAFLGILALSWVLTIASPARAVVVYALTDNNEIMVVDGDVPQNVLAFRTITGLTAGDTAIAMDTRPADGKLYLLTVATNFTAPRIYTLEPNTGVATLVAALTADPADVTAPLFTTLSGNHFAVDFNPQADRLRIVSDTGQNLRVNIGASTALVSADIDVAYMTALGMPPKINAIAYSNNTAGAGSTRLFDIDDANFKYAEQSLPNSGTLITPLDFNHAPTNHIGFDIAPPVSGNEVGYVLEQHFPGDINVPSREEWSLATFDPINYDPTTNPGVSHGPIGDGKIPIVDIAVGTSISFSLPLYSISEGNGGSPTAIITVQRSGFLNTPMTVQYSTLSNTAIAGTDYATASGTLTFIANDASEIIQVPIGNDDLPEGDEFVDLLLTGVTGPAVLSPDAFARLRINASDRPDQVGPQVLSIGLTGPASGIDGAVIFFNEGLESLSAVTIANYKITALPKRGKLQTIAPNFASYDPTKRTVTVGFPPLVLADFKRIAFRISGRAPNGVKDVDLNLLDGNRNKVPGGDVVQNFKIVSAAMNIPLKFADRDGDRAQLTSAGAGTLVGVFPAGGPADQRTQFWMVNPAPLQTALQGSVIKKPRGDGIVVISEVTGLDRAQSLPITTNPAFSIDRLTFSAEATGLGFH